jgi:hypothetical protein
VFSTKKGATEFLNSSERRPNMKQSASVCLSDNPYFYSFGKASVDTVDNPIVTPEKTSKSTATETFLKLFWPEQVLQSFLHLKEHPNRKAFSKSFKNSHLC